MSTIPLPRYTADLAQAPTDLPDSVAPAGLLPYTTFNDADIVARGYAQILSRMPTASQAAAEKRAELGFYQGLVNDAAKLVMSIGEAEARAQKKEDQMASLRIYENFRTRQDAVEVAADQAYSKPGDYLGTVEVARGKLMQEAFDQTKNDQQKLFLEQHVTPYNIESRRSVLRTAASKRVQGMLADANLTIQAETARLVASDNPAELKGAQLVIDETYRHLDGLVPADRIEAMRQETVRRALLDRLDKDVRNNPAQLLAYQLKEYEPGGAIASLFPDVPIRADDIAKARDAAVTRLKTMISEANTADDRARTRAKELAKDGMEAHVGVLYDEISRGRDPYGDPAQKDRLAYFHSYGASILGQAAYRTISEDLLKSAVGEFSLPSVHATAMANLFEGRLTRDQILTTRGLTKEDKSSLLKMYEDRISTFPYNARQFSDGLSTIRTSILGAEEGTNMLRIPMLGIGVGSGHPPATLAAWRNAQLAFYDYAKGVRTAEQLGDLTKAAADIAARYMPKPAAKPMLGTPTPTPQDNVPPTSGWRGYSLPK